MYLVFRDLQNKPYRNAYLERVRALMTLLPDAKLAIQARGRGNSDDVFYREHLGVDNAAMLKDVLAERSAIVVSVRLHGSLESVLAGVPSVHIAYERKGHAAFGDLGLDDFVFHASDFDPIAVANAVRLLDEEQYWLRVERRRCTAMNTLWRRSKMNCARSITLIMDGNFRRVGERFQSPHELCAVWRTLHRFFRSSRDRCALISRNGGNW